MAGGALGRALAAIVGAVAVLHLLAGLSMPVRDRAPGPLQLVAGVGLIAAHGVLYWTGERIRHRFRLRTYTVAQAITLFLIAIAGVPGPVAVGLFMAGTAELVVLAGDRWGTIPITMGAILLFVLASAITADLYRAATAGLLFALTGAIVHAGAALLRRPAAAPVPSEPDSRPAPLRGPAGAGPSSLSSREVEVLRALVAGARNSGIAAQLGITERTVKAHLRSIYQKLGVDSRSAAVALALQRKLV